jgi:hypothetical protein
VYLVTSLRCSKRRNEDRRNQDDDVPHIDLPQ